MSIKSILTFLPKLQFTFTHRMFSTKQHLFSDISNKSAHHPSKIIIEERYLLKRMIHKYNSHNVYEGIDFKASKFVMVYIKPASVEFNFSKKIKQDLRNKVSPPLLWSGIYKSDKMAYNVEVHQKYGPSLKSMFNYIKNPISESDLLLLLYQFIRLIEKYGGVGYVYRELDMDHVVFDSKPEKNDLYLLNVFSLKKKGEESQMLNTRFCSRGAHLGLRSSIKDDLQSICYILINIHTQGTFLRNVPTEDYAQAKANLDFSSFGRPLPSLLLDFYSYVINLNYNDEVNYFKWRNLIYRRIGKQAAVGPYLWMLAKPQQTEIDDTIEEGDLNQKKRKVESVEIEDEIKPEDKMLIERLQKSDVNNKKGIR